MNKLRKKELSRDEKVRILALKEENLSLNAIALRVWSFESTVFAVFGHFLAEKAKNRP